MYLFLTSNPVKTDILFWPSFSQFLPRLVNLVSLSQFLSVLITSWCAETRECLDNRQEAWVTRLCRVSWRILTLLRKRDVFEYSVLFESCTTTHLHANSAALDRKRISTENLGHTMMERPRNSLARASKSKRSQLSISGSIYWELEWRIRWRIPRRLLGVWLVDFLADSAAIFCLSGGFQEAVNLCL